MIKACQKRRERGSRAVVYVETLDIWEDAAPFGAARSRKRVKLSETRRPRLPKVVSGSRESFEVVRGSRASRKP